MKASPLAIRRALHSLAFEAIVFTSGIEAVERAPEASATLAEACARRVGEALTSLAGLGSSTDDGIGKACEELRTAREIFQYLATGERVTRCVAEAIRRYEPVRRRGGRLACLLDEAHSHTHTALTLLRKSGLAEELADVIDLVSKARRESAPTTLCRLACKMLIEGGVGQEAV